MILDKVYKKKIKKSRKNKMGMAGIGVKNINERKERRKSN